MHIVDEPPWLDWGTYLVRRFPHNFDSEPPYLEILCLDKVDAYSLRKHQLNCELNEFKSKDVPTGQPSLWISLSSFPSLLAAIEAILWMKSDQDNTRIMYYQQACHEVFLLPQEFRNVISVLHVVMRVTYITRFRRPRQAETNNAAFRKCHASCGFSITSPT